MKRAQVIDLLVKIAEEYNQVDTSDSEINRLYENLKDFPFDVAYENIRQHMLTNPWPPKIAQIRGGSGDLRDKGLLKDQTSEYFAERDRSRAAAKPVPAGWKEELYARLKSGATARH
ncbi:hypothetical protein MHB77_29325 [Paenibacillus sp. FSL K6-3166]|uniref:hypothetical protein n=1 Tax=unclassified Paenibacillus TaxID=185978 RepID=UPI000BA034F3|nr:hypothetical protein [Paenibacillus sp. VTT E-133291]OZQ95828.1 hypothetical protein CA598_08340 [Paenibacillus sp. VTT E-133291]